MRQRHPLQDVRVHLSGSLPDQATDVRRDAIVSFVEKFAAAIFQEGGALIHGSHPAFQFRNLWKMLPDHLSARSARGTR